LINSIFKLYTIISPHFTSAKKFQGHCFHMTWSNRLCFTILLEIWSSRRVFWRALQFSVDCTRPPRMLSGVTSSPPSLSIQIYSNRIVINCLSAFRTRPPPALLSS
jgi:hypothetical protein